MEKIAKSLIDLKEIASDFAKNIKPKDVICLEGELGSGKTTFTGMLVKCLGFESRVQSPTFVIARKYHRDHGEINTINHLDLYRITDVRELTDLDLAQYFEDNSAVTIIEWPKIAFGILSNIKCKIIKFKYLDENSRELLFEE